VNVQPFLNNPFFNSGPSGAQGNPAGANPVGSYERDGYTLPTSGSQIFPSEISLSGNSVYDLFSLSQNFKTPVSYTDAAIEITNNIAAAVTQAGGVIEWTGTQAAGLGDGSIALYLLWAARELKNPAYTKVAAQAGVRFLEVAEHEPDGDSSG
jgi:hypothetical protein